MKRSHLFLIALSATIFAGLTAASATERRIAVDTRTLDQEVTADRYQRELPPPPPSEVWPGETCIDDLQCMTGPCFLHPTGESICTKHAVGNATCQDDLGPNAVAIIVADEDGAESICVVQNPNHTFVPPCTDDDS